MYIPRNSKIIKKFVTQNSSESAFQTIASTVNDLPGTSVSFTPSSDATKVV